MKRECNMYFIQLEVKRLKDTSKLNWNNEIQCGVSEISKIIMHNNYVQTGVICRIHISAMVYDKYIIKLIIQCQTKHYPKQILDTWMFYSQGNIS